MSSLSVDFPSDFSDLRVCELDCDYCKISDPAHLDWTFSRCTSSLSPFVSFPLISQLMLAPLANVHRLYPLSRHVLVIRYDPFLFIHSRVVWSQDEEPVQRKGESRRFGRSKLS